VNAADDARFAPARRIPTSRWRVPLSPSEALELDEFLSQPLYRDHDPLHGMWHAHLTYSRRSAIALAAGDLWTAQRAAAIATHALGLHQQRGGADPLSLLTGGGEAGG
jgi:hypothetical protein